MTKAKGKRKVPSQEDWEKFKKDLEETDEELTLELGKKGLPDWRLVKISGSGLGYCDLVSFLKNLAIPNAEFGLQIAEFSICFRLGHRDQ